VWITHILSEYPACVAILRYTPINRVLKVNTIELSRFQVLNDFVEVIIVSNDTYFQWKQTEELNYKIIRLLTNNEKFPSQIAIAIKKLTEISILNC
jgi:hypothetical protein